MTFSPLSVKNVNPFFACSPLKNKPGYMWLNGPFADSCSKRYKRESLSGGTYIPQGTALHLCPRWQGHNRWRCTPAQNRAFLFYFLQGLSSFILLCVLIYIILSPNHCSFFPLSPAIPPCYQIEKPSNHSISGVVYGSLALLSYF